METFRLNGDSNRLYFKNPTNRPDEEEFTEIMDILHNKGAVITEKSIAPDCDWYRDCMISGKKFDVLYSIVGEGTFLYADDSKTIALLEKVFRDNYMG